MATLPKSSPYVVIGAGIHGLSTAYHLAKELDERGLGSGSDIVVLEKSEPGAGASGIACGVVRNNYFQPAMSELMQACAEVWESDPDAYAYNAVGYIALGPPVQEPDLAETFERQERIGYRSTLITGEADVDRHMKELFPDWRAQGVTACLHEFQGGFAFNQDSVDGLAGKARSKGVEILTGVEVIGLEFGPDEAVTAVETNQGTIEVGEQLIIAPGPWAKRFWSLLELPATIDVRTPSGDVELDPYPSTTDVDPGFADMWCAALSHSMSRFEGCRPLYKQARSGGVGAFTADNFPVFDYMRPNVYTILDSNHGYKMIGVGREVAKVVVGRHSSLLYPFRFERFATGDLHPVSHSPYPWS